MSKDIQGNFPVIRRVEGHSPVPPFHCGGARRTLTEGDQIRLEPDTSIFIGPSEDSEPLIVNGAGIEVTVLAIEEGHAIVSTEINGADTTFYLPLPPTTP